MATIADELGKADEAAAYRLRAANWTHLFKEDAVTLADGTTSGLIFPKNADGAWVNADPERFEAGNVYQGTLWQYNWYAAADMGGMIQLLGGEEQALAALSFMFGEHAPNDGRRMLHANANEIDLQAPYLFNYVGAPAKTQHWVRSIYTKETWNRYIATGSTHEAPSGNGEFQPPVKTKVFTNDPQGFLPTMDNDTGTMSSTFVAAALGLFPVLAGSDEYQIGSPFFENVRITNAFGRTFDIAAHGVSADDYYIQSATLNGQAFDRTWVTYDQLTAGGRLEFHMGDEPSGWGADGVAPSSLSDDLPSSVYAPTSALSIGSREFTESASGDGSIGNSIPLTLANGRFTGKNGNDLAASGVIEAENVPAGLTLVAERTGDRSVEMSLAGRAERAGTSGSIDDLTVRITDDAFDRKPSAGERTFVLKVTFEGAVLRADRTHLLAAPDGTLDMEVALTLAGESFAGADGRDLIADGDLALLGLPAGVTASAVKRDAGTVVLRLGGTLAAPAAFSLAFADGALAGGGAAGLRGDGVSGLGSLTLAVDPQWRNRLETLLAEADLVERGAYSASSFAAFSAARDEARAVLGDPSAADEVVRSALDALVRAGKRLAITPASDRVLLDGISYDEVAFDDDFSTDRLGEYSAFADGEPAASLAVDPAQGVLTATAAQRSWSHLALPVEAGESFALVVEPRAFAGTRAAEDSLFIGITDGPGNRVHSWYNHTRSETGFDAVVGGQGRDLAAGSATGVTWQPGDRLATVVDGGRITSWIEQEGAWRKLRSAPLEPAGSAADFAAWDPTLSLRLDPGAIAIDRITLLRADDAVAPPVRVEAESFSSSSGGSLVKEGTSPAGNVGGTYDGGELVYDAVDLGSTPVTTVTVRSSTRDERVGANPRLEFYLDDTSPQNRVADVALPRTGGWGNYVSTTVELDRPVTGGHRLVVVMHSDPVPGQPFQYVSNLDWFEFAAAPDAAPPVDRSALERAVADAQALLAQEDRFVAIDFAVFRAALEEAQRVVGADAATQAEVDEALRVLELAAGQLDYTVVRALPVLIAKAEAVERDVYTPESLAVLDAALAKARTVTGGASYEDYATAVAALEAAIAGLQKPGDPGTGEPGTGEPGTGEPGTGEPGTGEPGTGEPGTGEPGTGEPTFRPEAPVADGADLPLIFRDVIDVTVSGRTATVRGLPGDAWHFGYVYSSARALHWARTDADGSAVFTLPAGLEAGTHRLAVLDESGSLVGWTEFTYAVGGTAGAGDDLAVTGADATIVWSIAGAGVLLVLAGYAVLVRRRRGEAQ